MPKLFLAALCLILACGSATSPSVVQQQAASTSSPPLTKRCLLLTTNDSEAHFDGPRSGPRDAPVYAGSIARVAAVKQAQLAQRPGGVLLVEGGDVLQGRFMERADGDRPLAMRQAWQVYEAAGYDFGTLGNHEFDAGPKAVRFALQGLSTYRILTANLDSSGTPLDPADPAKPQGLYGKTALVDCGGIKLGLFGLLTPTTRTISQMGEVQMAADPLNGPARQAVADLRAQGAQLVVALSHLGVDEDMQLARDVTGIDAIVGGHSHTPLPKARRVGPTWITQTGCRFAFLGHLDLALSPDGPRLEDTQTTWNMVPINAQMPVDPAIEQQVNQLRAQLVPEVVIGQRSVAWDLTRPRGEYGVRAARAAALAAQQALPQLAKSAPVVGGLLNTGGFRSHTLYPPGPVTNLDIAAIHPFRNRLVVVTLDGQGLHDTLEHGCAPGSDGHGQGLVMWGLAYQCDRTKPAQQYTVKDGKPIAISQRGQRLVGATVGDQPIDLAKRYTIATVDYLAKGGSGYLPLALGDRRCLDGKVFGAEPDCVSPQFNVVMEAAVKDGSLDLGL